MSDAVTMVTTCACGEHEVLAGPGASSAFPSNHGATYCYIGGKHYDREHFQRPARDFVAALASERALFAELSEQHSHQRDQLEAARQEVRRLEAALERWRTLSLAQACVLAEDLQP